MINFWKHLQLKISMRSLLKNLQKYISKQNSDSIEYGNIRKGSKWGIQVGNRLIWIFLVDLVWKRSLQYKIIYNIDECHFTTSSNFDRYTQHNSLIQFNTKSFVNIYKKITQLVKDIPSFRERILREYIFSKLKNKLNIRWLKLSKKKEEQRDKEEKYLVNLIKNIYRGGRISQSEFERTIHYVNRVQSI